jgi:hypothetical protein
MRRQGANLESTVVKAPDAAQVANLAQADDVARLQQALLQQQDERCAARHQVRVVAVPPKQVERLLERAWRVIVERLHVTTTTVVRLT